MKKIMSAAAAAGIIVFSAATVFAADAIDAGGKARITIAEPSAPIVRTVSRQVSMDSAGLFTAAAPAAVAPAVVLKKAGTVGSLCLDSDCKTKLNM